MGKGLSVTYKCIGFLAGEAKRVTCTYGSGPFQSHKREQNCHYAMKKIKSTKLFSAKSVFAMREASLQSAQLLLLAVKPSSDNEAIEYRISNIER
jgi:hypothetical protein